jgi:hypothetical protein
VSCAIEISAVSKSLSVGCCRCARSNSAIASAGAPVEFSAIA